MARRPDTTHRDKSLDHVRNTLSPSPPLKRLRSSSVCTRSWVLRPHLVTELSHIEELHRQGILVIVVSGTPCLRCPQKWLQKAIQRDWVDHGTPCNDHPAPLTVPHDRVPLLSHCAGISNRQQSPSVGKLRSTRPPSSYGMTSRMTSIPYPHMSGA